MRGDWQVVRLADGAVTVRCTHRHELLADWCARWRDRFRPWWELGDGRHHIRRTPKETR